MGKQNKIVVWMNGQKTTLNRNAQSPDEKYSIKEFNQEQAAAVEVEDSNIPELVRRDDDVDHEVYFSRKSKLKTFKPFMLATLSALIVGSVLGFLMLNMFVDINEGLNQQNAPVPAMTTDEEDTSGDQSAADDNSDSALSTVTVSPVNAFVLQAGKFSEKVNADEMAESFQQAGFSPVIWQRDDFYYVLSGITDSREHGTQLVSEMAAENLEVFVKEWTTDSGEIQASDTEKEWLQSFETQWHDGLASLRNGENLSPDLWNEVTGKIPDELNETENLAVLLKEHDQIGQGDIWQDHQVLLNLWKASGQMVAN